MENDNNILAEQKTQRRPPCCNCCDVLGSIHTASGLCPCLDLAPALVDLLGSASGRKQGERWLVGDKVSQQHRFATISCKPECNSPRLRRWYKIGIALRHAFKAFTRTLCDACTCPRKGWSPHPNNALNSVNFATTMLSGRITKSTALHAVGQTCMFKSNTARETLEVLRTMSKMACKVDAIFSSLCKISGGWCKFSQSGAIFPERTLYICRAGARFGAF